MAILGAGHVDLVQLGNQGIASRILLTANHPVLTVKAAGTRPG